MANRVLWAAVLGLVSWVNVGQADAAGNLSPVRLNVNFVDYCDGLNITIFDRIGVLGRHTGCGSNELVIGSEFFTEDDERVVQVQYFDRTVNRLLRVDLYRTGFRANKFYIYESRTGLLLRYGNFTPAPPAP